MIEIKNVSYSYENAVTDGALKNVSLCIPQGQTVLLCGESGSGKTTFGRLVNGLIPCYYEGKLTGSVMVNGNDTTQLQLHELAGTVGSVFQNPKSQFYTLLTDTEIIFACENIGMEKREILRRFTEAVQDFRLEKLLGKNVSQLSSGEKRKLPVPLSVCLGRRSSCWMSRHRIWTFPPSGSCGRSSQSGRRREKLSSSPSTGSGG